MWQKLKRRFSTLRNEFRFITRIVQIIAGIVGGFVVIIGIIYSDDTNLKLLWDEFLLHIIDISKFVDFYKYEIFLGCLILVALGVWVRLRHVLKLNARYIMALNVVASTKVIHSRILNLINRYHLQQKSPDKGLELGELQILVHECLRSSCSRLATAITDITGDESHVCLKTFNPKTAHVEPVVRDDNPGKFQRPSGRQYDGYRFEENTGLAAIVNDQREVYLCEDLMALGSAYKNKSGDWEEYYNATIIQALSSYRAVSSDRITGFICLDNMRGGFGSSLVKTLLTEFSTFYCQVFEVMMSLTADDVYKNPMPDVVKKLPRLGEESREIKD